MPSVKSYRVSHDRRSFLVDRNCDGYVETKEKDEDRRRRRKGKRMVVDREVRTKQNEKETRKEYPRSVDDLVRDGGKKEKIEKWKGRNLFVYVRAFKYA